MSRKRPWVRDEIARHAPAAGTFDPDRHEYRIEDVVVPSVTQVLTEERFIDFSRVPDGILAEAQARGTYVHACLHAWLEDDFDLDDCDPRFRGYLDSALAYLATLRKTPLRDAEGHVLAVEARFWHRKYWFAGTMDYVGLDADGVLSIDDWKTGEPSDVAAPLQLAAYELGLRDCLLPTFAPGYVGIIRRRAVKLQKDGTPARVESYTDSRDLPMFLRALSCVHFRRNGMRHERSA